MDQEQEEGSQRQRCGHCGETLSVDEPVIVVVRGQNVARTSLAAIGGLLEDGVVLVHEGCYDAAAVIPGSADERPL
jgi:hypothetical protein